MEKLQAEMAERLPKLIHMLEKQSAADAQEIWDEALEQERDGLLGPALAVKECPQDALFIRRWRLSRPGQDGRSIDDASSGPGGNGMNDFTCPHDKLQLPGPPSITACLKAHSLLFQGDADDDPYGSKDDMKSAYKQFTTTDSLLLYVLLLHPQTRQVQTRRAYTLLFGELGAVYIFLRVVAAVCFVLHCDFAVPVEAFFDDFWHWSPRWAAADSTACLHFFFDTIGLTRKKQKYVSPRPCLPILGVKVSTRRASGSDDVIVFENDQVKITKYVEEVRSLREAGKDSISQRTKLAHKLCFAGEALYGQSGAAARRILFAPTRLEPRLLISVLTVWERLLLRGRPREVPVNRHPQPPVLVWTDAQLRTGSVPRLGGFLLCPSGHRAYFIVEMVDSWVNSTVHEPDFCIAQMEAYAAAVAVATWHNFLAHASCIFFIDNKSAMGALIKGSSPAGDLSDIVATTWDELNKHTITAWFEYVPSHLNMADPMSRGDASFAESFGAKKDIARLPAVLPL